MRNKSTPSPAPHGRAALVAAGGGALWLALGVHRDRYSKEVAAVVRQPPSEAALAVSRRNSARSAGGTGLNPMR